MKTVKTIYFSTLLKNKSLRQYLYCFVISALFLLIRTKSSPLYPFNDWVDVNAFFTVGKAMFNGVVTYKDIFEQKGPLLYFIFGGGYLISNYSFVGIYIIETLFFSFFLFTSAKITNLFIDKKYILFTVPLIAFLILYLPSFAHGGSAEEICLPFFMLSLFYLLKYFKNIYPSSPNLKIILLNGIIAGCILWIKYSLLGFWFGWIIALCLALLYNKKTVDILKVCIIFLLGMMISTLPWIIYFGLNNAIYDWLNTYILINFNHYRVDLGFVPTLRFIHYIIKSHLISSKLFSLTLLLGLTYLFTTKVFYKKIMIRFLITIPFIFLIFSVYGGGVNYIYYFFILSPSVIFGVISLIDIVSKYIKIKLLDKYRNVLLIISSFLLLFLLSINNENSYLLNTPKEQLVQYKFAKIINQTPNATLLNFGSLDNGIYTTTGIIPNIKHFETQNIAYESFSTNIDEQKRYVIEGITDYVVVRKPSKIKDLSIFDENYRMIAKQKQFFEDDIYCYLLFIRINQPIN